jgi:hypothetical protein
MWIQNFKLHVCTSNNGLSVYVQTEFNDRPYDVIEAPLETLLLNFYKFIDDEHIGCSTEQMKSASSTLRLIADRIDEKIVLSNSNAKEECCVWCDNQTVIK